MSGIHRLFSGDLVTSAGRTWRFAVPLRAMDENDRIDWLYGTFASETTDPKTGAQVFSAEIDTDEDWQPPTKWLPAGTGFVSDEIAFPHARPYTVVAILTQGNTSRVLRDRGTPAEEVFVRTVPGAGVELTGTFRGADVLVGDGLLARVGDGEGVGGTVTRPPGSGDGSGGLGSGPERTFGWTTETVSFGGSGLFTEAPKPMQMCKVYPGKLVIDEVPEVIACGTEGFLPVHLSLLGLSRRVRIVGFDEAAAAPAVKYGIEVKGTASRSVMQKTPRFTLSKGTIDMPSIPQKPGGGSQYIVYLDPKIIRTIGRLGEVSILNDVSLEVSVSARPNAVKPATHPRFEATSRGVRFYVDDRVNLQHFERYEDRRRYAMTAGNAADKGRAQRFVHLRLSTEDAGVTTQVENGLPVVLPGLGTAVELGDYSAADGSDINLGAQVTHRGVRFGEAGRMVGPQTGEIGDAIDNRFLVGLIKLAVQDALVRMYPPLASLSYEVEGARRAALIFPYYRLAKRVPRVLGGGKLCLVGSSVGSSGSLRVVLHGDDPAAAVAISGLAEDDDYFDFAGVVSSVSAGAAAVLSRQPIAAAVLTVVSVIAGIFWSRLPDRPAPRTAAEIYVETGLRILGYDEPVARIDRPRHRSPATRTRSGKGALGVGGSWDSVHLRVGEALNVYQLVIVGLEHRLLQVATLRASFEKGGYDRALEVTAG